MFNACEGVDRLVCAWHKTQIEKTFKVFSVFSANLNEAAAEFCGKFRNILELQVDGDKREP